MNFKKLYIEIYTNCKYIRLQRVWADSYLQPQPRSGRRSWLRLEVF